MNKNTMKTQTHTAFEPKAYEPSESWQKWEYNVIETFNGEFIQSWGPYDTYMDAKIAAFELEDMCKINRMLWPNG
jgi:hypothetical protein